MYYEILGKGEVHAVDNVSFSLDKGETLGIVGESGCGKSSLAITILRLLPINGKIYGGEMLLNGEDILNMDLERFRREIRWKRISIVFQGAMNALNPVIKVGDQIAEAIMIHEKISKKEAMKRVIELLEMVGIDASRATSYPFEFSGGMRQRAMIAMALALNPEILIADEPTTALDVIVQAQILKLIKDIQRKLKLSVILISHDISMVSELSDRIAVMYAGQIVELGNIVDVYVNPLHPYTKALLSSVPSIKEKRRKLKSIPGAPPNLLNPPSGCRFHLRCPFKIDLCAEKEPDFIRASKGHFVKCHRFEELRGVDFR
ncbi:MAG: ABC transporter ATP-binding protein [archaeon GB-1867-035]|nr:ABC transporter ATP-binding protein [Candidatus Culexmicrobium profundum]